MSTVHYDEKGKFFTKVVTKDMIQVLIQTLTHRIRGFVHVRRGERLKDELNRTEQFLAVTDAVVYSESGGVLYESDFISINRSQVVWLIPVEDEMNEPGDQS